MSTEIHIAGLPIEVGSQLRQRCGWCGAVLEDVDQSRIAVAVQPGEEPGRYPTWEVGSLVARDGGATWAVDHKDGDQLPPECCGQLDHEVTA